MSLSSHVGWSHSEIMAMDVAEFFGYLGELSEMLKLQ